LELLLFLSALLTALTGAVSGARAPEAQIHQSCGAIAGTQRTTTTTRLHQVRPAKDYLAFAGKFLPSAVPSLSTMVVAQAASFPIYLDKPRN
jgi:hypothetical protein